MFGDEPDQPLGLSRRAKTAAARASARRDGPRSPRHGAPTASEESVWVRFADLQNRPAMFDRFEDVEARQSAPPRLLGAARSGLALTWACAAFGTMALIDNFCSSTDQPPAATRNGMGRVDNIQLRRSSTYRIQSQRSRCPTTRDDSINKYDRYVGSAVHSWTHGAPASAYWKCHTARTWTFVRRAPTSSSTPADDITRE